MEIERWVAEQRLAQGKSRRITDETVLAKIKSIISDLPPKDEPAEIRIAS